MLIGYARVSTAEQDLTPQLVALKEAGCDRTFSDKASGAKANRTGLAEALSHAREGDVLVVWKLDRLGRTMKGLVDLAAELAGRGIGIRSITDGIDTAGTAGKLVFHIMAAMAEMERDLVRERALLQRLAAVRGRLSLCADQAAAAKWWLSMPMASVSAEGPMPKALSTRRTSPLMPGCRHQGRACPLRRARMTSNPLIVA